MRTAILNLLFSCWIFGVNAVYGQKANPDPNAPVISVGLHIGFGISDVSDNQLALPISQTNLSSFDRQRPVNERLGVQILFHIGEEYGIESGIFYEKKGVKAIGAYDPITNSFNLESDAVTRFNYEYFTIPILFKKVFPTQGAATLSLHVGPYIAFLENAVYSYTTTILIQNPNGSLFESVREEAFQIEDYSRDKDIGVRFRLGAEQPISSLTKLFGYVFYSRGLTRIDEFTTNNTAEIGDGRHEVMGLTVGAFFRMK